MNKKSLFGITIIGVLEITIGAYGIFLSLDLLASFKKISENLTPYMAEKFRGAVPTGIITLILASIMIFLGISLIRKNRISRLLHIILSPLIAIFAVNTIWGIVIRLISVLHITNLSELLTGIVLITAVVFGYLYYFTRSHVKEQFV